MAEQNSDTYYNIIDTIGCGGFGIVYKGIKKNSGAIRAIKKIDISIKIRHLLSQFNNEEINNESQKYLSGFKNEFNNMKLCSKNNNNSVECYEYFIDDKYFTIIMELCNDNLLGLLEKRINKKKQVLIQMKYLK